MNFVVVSPIYRNAWLSLKTLYAKSVEIEKTPEKCFLQTFGPLHIWLYLSVNVLHLQT